MSSTEHRIGHIDWSAIKCVIFDVDGTLYDQRGLRMRMILELMVYYLKHPLHLKDLKILMDFRLQREIHRADSTPDLDSAQYQWGAEASGVSLEMVRSVVEKWIYEIPLKYIAGYRLPDVPEFFANLKKKGILTAIFSDYPAAEKIAVLRLSPRSIFCATDKNINCLKPDPKGLLVIAETLGVPISQCLLIGDREDNDGECARRAGMKYLIIERENSGLNNHFQRYKQLNEQLNY